MLKAKIRQWTNYHALLAETTGESVPVLTEKQKSSEDRETDKDKNERKHRYIEYKEERLMTEKIPSSSDAQDAFLSDRLESRELITEF